MLNYADPDGTNCWPGNEKLPRDTCQSISAVKRHLKTLRNAGYLKLVSQGRKGKNGVGWHSRYELTLPPRGLADEPLSQGVIGEPKININGSLMDGQGLTRDMSGAHSEHVKGSPMSPVPDHPPNPLPHRGVVLVGERCYGRRTRRCDF
ncbi:helix-turn-helix domain-containing protein [Mycobacterium sp. NPDC003449]